VSFVNPFERGQPYCAGAAGALVAGAAGGVAGALVLGMSGIAAVSFFWQPASKPTQTRLNATANNVLFMAD
jgi:hypothetical protein